MASLPRRLTGSEEIMKKALLLAIIPLLIACFCSAQQKGTACCPADGIPCPPEMRMQKMQPPVRAEDWVNAWQAAKEACANADTLTVQLADRSGPSLQGLKVFECVDLKSSGELLIIKVKKADKQTESVLIIRASDMLRIEIAQRAVAEK